MKKLRTFNLEKESQGQRASVEDDILDRIIKVTQSSDQQCMKNHWADLGSLSGGS